MPESCCKPSEGLQQLMLRPLANTRKGTAVRQSVCNAATITNWPLLSLFSRRREVKKSGKIDLFRPTLGKRLKIISQTWLEFDQVMGRDIWAVQRDRLTVLFKLSLIKLPTGNLMKLETTLKACWSTDCWSASERKYFRSMFWPVAIVFVTIVNMREHRLWSGCAERTKRAFWWPLIRK